MGNTLKIRSLELGSGTPKICVPITGGNNNEVLEEVKLAKDAGADVIEWRADYYGDVMDFDKTVALAKEIRSLCGEMLLLFTYRTEGCENSIELKDYIALNKLVADKTEVDLIDIELFMGDEVCVDFCEYAHERNIKVIISSHDFEKTPKSQVIVERLCKMRKLGADIPKIAVMPEKPEDVLTLLSATNQYATAHADSPLITMSMKWLGSISRVSGEIFGSALTFGTTTKASAPGQLAVEDLKNILRILHKPEDQ